MFVRPGPHTMVKCMTYKGWGDSVIRRVKKKRRERRRRIRWTTAKRSSRSSVKSSPIKRRKPRRGMLRGRTKRIRAAKPPLPDVRDGRMILVIDHSVPQFDKDTGSRNLYQYLQLFSRMGLDVKFIGADGVRHEPYATALERVGVQVLSDPAQGIDLAKWLRKHGREIRYAYLLRPYIAGIYMDLVRKHTRAKLIYNGVDFHYLRELRRYELDGDPATLESANRFKEHEFMLFAKSDVIYTVSEYEKALLETHMPGKRVVAVPTYIYDEPFPLGESKSFEERSGLIFVGGFAHQPNADGIHWFVNEIFPLVSRELPDVTLTIIGSNPPPSVASLSSDRIKVTGYVSDEALRDFYSSARLAIAPVRFGAGVKGKIIEACAHGVPVVTTPIGAEGILDVNEIATSAESAERFADHIVDLYLDRGRWLETRNRQIRYSERYLGPDYALSILSQDIGGM